MTSWPKVSLGELCLSKTGTVDPTKNPDRQFLYIDITSIDVGRKEVAEPRWLSGRDAPSRARRHVLNGDVIVSMTRPNLNAVALIGPEYSGQVCSTGFCVLRPGPRLDTGYLFHFVRTKSFVRALTALVSGALYPAVSEGQVRQQVIPLPPIKEQRRIVDILDRAASIRRLRQQADNTTCQIVPALFNKMFGDPSSNSTDWPVLNLRHILADGIQNGLYRPATAYGQGTRILRIDSFYDGEVQDINTLRRLSLDSATIQKYLLRSKDIVLNRVNSLPYLGKSAIIPAMDEPVVFESNMMRFSTNPEQALPEYVIAYLQTPFARKRLVANAKAAINQASINQQDVGSLPIPVPTLAAQTAFVERAKVISQVVQQQTRAVNAAELASRAIEARMFSA